MSNKVAAMVFVTLVIAPLIVGLLTIWDVTNSKVFLTVVLSCAVLCLIIVVGDLWKDD